jgi:hypothetical protein
MRKRATKEEKVARDMIELVNDLTLDLDQVGYYIGEQSSVVLYNRLDTVIDSARDTKEEQIERYNNIR